MKQNLFQHGWTKLAATAALAGVIALAGCSSTPPTHVDEGPVKAATFNFINGGVPVSADFTDNDVQVHKVIQEALTTALAKKGVTKATNLGDITVAYLIITGNNYSTMSINKYFGYGRDSSGLQDVATDAYTGTKNPNYFEAGTLVIDIVDNRTHELLRRTHATRPLLRDPSPEVRRANIQEAVNAALASLQITR